MVTGNLLKLKRQTPESREAKDTRVCRARCQKREESAQREDSSEDLQRFPLKSSAMY